MRKKSKRIFLPQKKRQKNNTGGNSSSASTSEKEDSFSIFKKKAIASSGSGFDFYLDNKGVRKTAAYTKIPETDWTLVAYAEEKSLWVLFITLSVCFASLQARAF